MVIALFATAVILSACGKKAPLETPPPREEKETSDVASWVPIG